MAFFHYRAFSAQGDLSQGEIEARSREEAEEAVWARGLTPFETWPAGNASKPAFFLFGGGRLTANDVSGFTREFALLLEADVPLDRALAILQEQAPNARRRKLAESVLRRLLDGSSLSDALEAASNAFGDGYISVVRAGEAMGGIGSALAQMADVLERRQELRARMQTALIYPLVLICLAMISTGVVVGVLAPAVAPIFVEAGKPMPAGLQFVVDVETRWPFLLGALFFLLLCAFWLRMESKRRPKLKASIDRFLLDLPLVGKWKAQRGAAQFARTLGALLKAGVPLLSGLESAAQAVDGAYLRQQLLGLGDPVANGARLSQSLAQIPRLPPLVAQLAAVGEEAGQLAPMLLRVAALFERATERAVERTMSLLTPLLTVLIATLVGGLVLTVMNAVLGINELAAQ